MFSCIGDQESEISDPGNFILLSWRSIYQSDRSLSSKAIFTFCQVLGIYSIDIRVQEVDTVYKSEAHYFKLKEGITSGTLFF